MMTKLERVRRMAEERGLVVKRDFTWLPFPWVGGKSYRVIQDGEEIVQGATLVEIKRWLGGVPR